MHDLLGHEQLMERFRRGLRAYAREHRDADEAELRAYGELLETAIPGLREALRARCEEMAVIAALVSDRGDGLPAGGPSTGRGASGERSWKILDLWTLKDYRLNLAWYREPGGPATQLAALIAYGETRWPGEDFSRGPWPDTSDLPDWQDLAADLAADDDEG
jgi:hypothetical protein